MDIHFIKVLIVLFVNKNESRRTILSLLAAPARRALENNRITSNKAIEIAENIIEVEMTLPKSGKIIRRTLLKTEEQRYLNSIFDFGC